MSLPALRRQLSALLAPPRAGGAAVLSTGIAALDRALSDGGLPSGRLTEVLGARGSGRTTLVRQVVLAAVTARRWVAVIDGSRTLVPREWAAAGDSGRLRVVRPPTPDRSAWCADILLRSGAFSLVVLDGAPPLPRPVAVRLTRLAKEHDVALVIVGDGPVVGSAVRLRVTRDRGRETAARFTIHDSRFSVLIEKGGTQHHVGIHSAIEMARRLGAYPEVPDRRGVARRNRWGKRVEESPGRPAAGRERAAGSHGAAPRQRRFGEAASTRDRFLLDRTRQRGARGRRSRQQAAGSRRQARSHEQRSTSHESRSTSHESRSASHASRSTTSHDPRATIHEPRVTP